MSNLPPPKTATSRLFRLGVFAVSFGLVFALPGYGQVSPEDHKKHHPGQDKEKDKAGMPGMAPGGKEPGKEKGGGMMGGGMDMGKMMENMGKAPPKELYPTLMSLPDLTPEQREQVRGQAHERMLSGVALLSKALDRLGEAAENEDYTAMQEATGEVREAVARFESGLAAKRALAEGKPPRQVALQWFKGEMNLQPPQGVEARGGGFFGVSLFHLFTMVLLVAFALVMVAMYFFKMRRAAALFERIESGAPPGSAPPLAAPPAADAKAKPKADPKAAPPAADAKGALPVAEAKAATPAADAKAAPPAADAKAAPPVAPPAADTKATPAAAEAKAKPPVATPLAADARAAPQQGAAATKFACRAPAAREVFLTGTFNGWNPKATPMIKDTEGNWEVAVPLRPGRYEFKFAVDGVLCCEPGCEGSNHGCPKCVPNSSGTMNRLIEVT